MVSLKSSLKEELHEAPKKINYFIFSITFSLSIFAADPVVVLKTLKVT